VARIGLARPWLRAVDNCTARPSRDGSFTTLMGVIGFDFGRRSRGSGPRMPETLVNHVGNNTSANYKRTSFALAA